jgi:hypothetical protein
MLNCELLDVQLASLMHDQVSKFTEFLFEEQCHKSFSNSSFSTLNIGNSEFGIIQITFALAFVVICLQKHLLSKLFPH